MKFIKWMVPAVIGVMTLGLTACGDDDNDDDADYNDANSGSVITDNSGNKLLVSRVGGTSFAYNSRGFLTSFNNGSIDWNTMKFNAGDEIYDMEINAAGYITELDMRYSESGDGWSAKGGEEWDFRYNGNGELVSISVKHSESGVDDGEAFTSSGSVSATLNWNNGVLTTLRASGKGSDEGDPYTETMNFDFTYAANALDNKTRQYTVATAPVLLEEDFAIAALGGVFGKGSAKLPATGKETRTENYAGEESESWEYNYNFAFTLNSNGTVATEEWSGEQSGTFNYSYTTFDAPQNVPAKVRAAMPSIFKNMRSMKRHSARR